MKQNIKSYLETTFNHYYPIYFGINLNHIPNILQGEVKEILFKNMIVTCERCEHRFDPTKSKEEVYFATVLKSFLIQESKSLSRDKEYREKLISYIISTKREKKLKEILE